MRPSTIYFFLFGFCASLLLPSFWERFNLKVVSFFITLLSVCVFLFFLRARRIHQETIIFWALLVFLFGFLLATIRLDLVLTKYQKQKEALSVFIGKEIKLQGIVHDRPKETERSRRFTVTLLSIEGKILENNPKILVITDLFSSVSRGQRVSFLGTVTLPESFSEEGGIVNWPKILARDGIFYQSLFPKDVLVLEENTSFFTFNFLYDRAVLSLATLLPLPERALGQGILLGKNFRDTTLLTHFRQAGLSHIVVLSGFNLIIIIRGLLSIAPFVGRQKAVLFGVIGIFIFLFSVGPEPPLWRATIMTLAVILGEVVGRPNVGSRVLYFAFFLLLLFDPLLVSSDVSFQLSFLATAGIVYLEPHINNRINKKDNFLLSVVSTTLAAQLIVLPLLVFTFGSVSPYFLIANVLTLPVVPIIMLLGVLALVASLVSASLAVLLAWPLYGFLKYVLFVASGISSLPGATFLLPDFSLFFLFLSYALFFGFFIYRDEFSRNSAIARSKGVVYS